MEIDRQRIAAVRVLEALGYVYRGGEWLPPAGVGVQPLSMMSEADAMHAALVRALAGCLEGSDGEAELRMTADLIEAYEAKRWPLGRDPSVPGGKG